MSGICWENYPSRSSHNSKKRISRMMCASSAFSPSNMIRLTRTRAGISPEISASGLSNTSSPAGGAASEVDEAKELIRAASAASLNEAIVNATPNAITEGSKSPWWRSISKYFAFHPLVLRKRQTARRIVALAGSWLLVRQFQRERAEGDASQHEEAARGQQEGKTVAPPVNENSTNGGPVERRPIRVPTGRQLVHRSFHNLELSTNNPHSHLPRRLLQSFWYPSARVAIATQTRYGFTQTHAQYVYASPSKGMITAVTTWYCEPWKANVCFIEVRSRPDRMLRKDRVAATLDPSIFRRQDYIVTLNGITASGTLDAIGEYYFRVERSPTKTTSRPPQ